MATVKKTPVWLVVGDDQMQVILSKPSTVNGVLVDRLNMRSPTVRDVRASNAAGNGDDELREMNLFASLTESGHSDLEGLKLTDYQRLQAAYFRLVQDVGI